MGGIEWGREIWGEDMEDEGVGGRVIARRGLKVNIGEGRGGRANGGREMVPEGSGGSEVEWDKGGGAGADPVA